STERVAIDMPAGPSEVLVIADATANPVFIAADLLSQAEHGADSQAVLLTCDPNILEETKKELERQLVGLPRAATAKKALEHSRLILLEDIDRCIAFSNMYAPEHLIIQTEQAEELCEKVQNAGSVFIGHYTPESAGDYASGTNHTLPTNGFARNYSGVSLDSYVKMLTFQHIDEKGLERTGPSIERMAEEEELAAHKRAVTLRLEHIKNRKSK
ncbi:MAG: histidinol dehydrogenase, partial [FCB group bacterium]|nr:histidinol dehydrogenase [FCB group bacterium]